MVTIACVVLGVGSAFLVTRTDLPGRRIFGVLAALPLAVPTYVAAFAWVVHLVDRRVRGVLGRRRWCSPSAPTRTCSCPSPRRWSARTRPQEEVSRSLGRGGWRTFLGVTLRQVRPAVAAGALLVALYVLSDFGAVSILRADTFTRAIFISFDLGFDRTGALVLATVLVVLTVVVLAGETATRRRGARYARLGGGAAPAGAPAAAAAGRGGRPRPGWSAVAALALGVPAVSLVRWFAAGVSRPGSLAEVAAAAGKSLWVSLLGAGVDHRCWRCRSACSSPAPRARWPPGWSGSAYLAHALPGVVIGLSLVFFGINVAYPLYQTRVAAGAGVRRAVPAAGGGRGGRGRGPGPAGAGGGGPLAGAAARWRCCARSRCR